MTGFYCDVPLPPPPQISPSTAVIGATLDDLDEQARRLHVVVTVSYAPHADRYYVTARDPLSVDAVLECDSSSRAGVLAKAVGELRQL